MAWWLALAASAAGEEPSSATPSPQAVEALRLVESKDPYQQQLGFLRLEALREISAVPLILPYVTHRDPEMRAYALRALAAIEGAQAVPRLLESLRTDKQPRVRRAALLGLEPLQQSEPQILPAFIRALRDKNTEVRMAAVDIVSRVDDPRARDAILVRNKRERRRDVRRVLSMAMKRLGQP
jgi:HEAT repeat protein